MGRVVHFEITADNMTRAKAFYEIFDWNVSDAGMPGGGYLLAQTGEEGTMGTDGAIMSRDFQSQPAIIWISVDDLGAMIERVTAAGGTIAGERQTVPGIGDTVYARDTEGNVFGMIEALPRQG